MKDQDIIVGVHEEEREWRFEHPRLNLSQQEQLEEELNNIEGIINWSTGDTSSTVTVSGEHDTHFDNFYDEIKEALKKCLSPPLMRLYFRWKEELNKPNQDYEELFEDLLEEIRKISMDTEE